MTVIKELLKHQAKIVSGNTKIKFSRNLDKIILIFLTIQISSAGISIAVSSISFGIWLGLWLMQIILRGKISEDNITLPELKQINIFVILYILFEILSRFFAIYPEGAFINLKRLLLFLIFYVSVIKIREKNILMRMLMTVVCTVSVISVYEIIKYAVLYKEMISGKPFSEIRIDYFNYPITGAEIKMMIMVSVFPLIFIKENFLISKKYLIGLLAPVFISMLLTQSRNVFLATAVCLSVYGIFVNRKFLIVFLIITILGWLLLPAEFTDRFRSIIDMNHLSNKSRISMWKVGWQMFLDHPLTGVADSHIKEIYQTYKIPEEASEGVHLHNNLLMILATTGIFGFISFVGIFISILISQIKYYIKEKNVKIRMLLFGSILVFLSFQISGIFDWSFGDHEVMTVFFFLISVPFVINKLNQINNSDEFSQDIV